MSFESSSPGSGPSFNAYPAIEERVGVQPRGPEFGDGVTQRVYEVQYGDYIFGINMGDVAQVPTEAVMLPSTPWLQIGGGAIENVLHGAIGYGVYNSYANMIRSSLEACAELPEGPIKSDQRKRLVDQFVTYARMDRNKAAEAAARLTGGSYMANMEGPGGERRSTVELEYGEAVPGIAGDLSYRGINSVVIVNVTPSEAPGRESGMTSGHMAMFTRNAAKVAAEMGASSITIPAVGTGMAVVFGFGMSMEDSLRGFFQGAKQFADSGGAGELRRLDFNIYARPSEENAQQAAELARDARILDLLAGQE